LAAESSQGPRLSARIAIDPASNGGERGEVSIVGSRMASRWTAAINLAAAAMLCDLEIRYALERDAHGL